MGKFKRRQHQQEAAPVDAQPSTVEPSAGAEADVGEEAIPVNNFEEAAAKIEEAGGDPTAPTEPVTATNTQRAVLPDALGNTVKGERHCSNCGVSEKEMLEKNPRYSLCKGVCVKCYSKLFRKAAKKPEDLTVEEIKAKIAHFEKLLAEKSGAQGLSEASTIANADENAVKASIESHGASEDATIEPLDELAMISN
jgi:hypothetical protein